MTIKPEQPINLLIKEKARELGFDLCGIARSKPLSEHEAVLKEWTEKGMNGEMGYLGQNIPKRINPELLVPGAKTVIVTGLNYYSDNKTARNNVPIISRYAYGADYHDVIMERLSLMLDFIKEKFKMQKAGFMLILHLYLRKPGERKPVSDGREGILY